MDGNGELVISNHCPIGKGLVHPIKTTKYDLKRFC